jgi:agmatinase
MTRYGAQFDGGTSHRPGTRFGPMAIRQSDYLPQDGSRPHLANRVCLEALSGLAVRKRGISHDPAGPLLEGR